MDIIIDSNIMDVQRIVELISDDLKRVEDVFKDNLKSDVPLISTVGEYVLLSGGKRLRPLVLLLSARVCGYKGDHHILLASVVEFIHTATLLHDDVVDKADLRRGQSSSNLVWGNEASVLVGDFLYSQSFSMAIKSGSMKVLETLSDATTKMAQGMVFELMNTGDIEMPEADYLKVVINKTAVLIAASCQVGGILADVDEAREKALRDYGMNVGIAFQLMDDRMDYDASVENFGKTIGQDLLEGKVTLPLIKTLRECSEDERKELATLLNADSISDEDLSMALDLINKYKGLEYTLEKAREHIAVAKDSLKLFPESEDKSALLCLADYVLEREN